MKMQQTTDETKVTQRKLGIGTIMYNWTSGSSKITNTLKQLCEKYDDDSMNIPNVLNVIANII